MIAQALSIAPSCLSKWRKLRRETGALKPGKMNGQVDPDRADRCVAAHAAWFGAVYHAPTCRRARGARGQDRPAGGVGVCDGRRAELQKKPRCPPNRIALTSPASAGAGKPIKHASPPAAWSFSTRHGSRPTWPRCAGWGPRGQRLPAKVPYGHWQTLTFIAALRHDRVEAPLVIDGPINGAIFTAYVEQALAPTLRPGDLVILDNLGSHKGKAVRRAIRDKGAHLLFLPPYSPDLNPIEQLFAKLKHLMRKAEERAHEATWRRVGQLLDLVCPSECANYLKNAGYASV
jgi:transposase